MTRTDDLWLREKWCAEEDVAGGSPKEAERSPKESEQSPTRRLGKAAGEAEHTFQVETMQNGNGLDHRHEHKESQGSAGTQAGGLPAVSQHDTEPLFGADHISSASIPGQSLNRTISVSRFLTASAASLLKI